MGSNCLVVVFYFSVGRWAQDGRFHIFLINFFIYLIKFNVFLIKIFCIDSNILLLYFFSFISLFFDYDTPPPYFNAVHAKDVSVVVVAASVAAVVRGADTTLRYSIFCSRYQSLAPSFPPGT